VIERMPPPSPVPLSPFTFTPASAPPRGGPAPSPGLRVSRAAVKTPSVRLRHFLLSGLLALAFVSVARAADAGIAVVRVFPEWRAEGSFKRISEYFTGVENTGGEVVLRTHPEKRGGYYFLVRLTHAGAPQAVKFILTLITPDSAVSKVFTFPATVPDGKTVFNLGLTGADWTNPKLNPVAWKLDITDESGRAIAKEKSFLWEKPAGAGL